ncbi:MAG TPA: dienelactone hydrolase family protein [Dehalococcoidia bacterium]
MDRARNLPGETPIRIKANRLILEGNLSIPKNAKGIVLFAHGSGSSRFSPRNTFVAGELQKANLATMLFDLLTHDEERIDAVTAQLRFDIRLLADRLILATDWITHQSDTARLKIGYFGASTGAAAALLAAAERTDVVKAVVSRGGRPDLAGPALPKVKAPTLLIVGGNDPVVIDLNRKALKELKEDKDLVIVTGASHLFEEPGTLEEVSRLATKWFQNHLTRTD